MLIAACPNPDCGAGSTLGNSVIVNRGWRLGSTMLRGREQDRLCRRRLPASPPLQQGDPGRDLPEGLANRVVGEPLSFGC